MSKVSIEVSKNPNENNASILRRFSRRVQETGMLSKVKAKRYSERAPSKLSLKNKALKRIIRRKEVEKLKKLGKMSS
jgi:ribosomal protein S21